MATSQKQVLANQNNAQLSTGPVTEAGKAVAARNAVRHGIFSDRLLLGDESEDTYQGLLEGLVQALRPEGSLEFALVEKIAVNLWRQRRLVRAEQATTALRCKPSYVASRVSDEYGRNSIFSDSISEEELGKEIDEEEIAWCQHVLQEVEALQDVERVDPTALKKRAPLIHAQLSSDAAEESLSIKAYLGQLDNGIEEYIEDIADYCQKELTKAERRPQLLALAELVRAERAIPLPEAREKLARYQTTLDNQLFKTLQALREAQRWRLGSLQSEAIVDDAVDVP